ncbi:MAG: hypothetical protein EAZ61_04255 [Oscillatoriales cyanobacterium]|jgi:hypothetical protein|nr:MAG: hypothetical protein EAZ61_04255 [Oscillatoriales cyanobacterium]
MKPVIRGFLLAFCTFTAILCFDTFARPNNNLGPTSVLAANLGLSIETVGIGAGIFSGLCITGFIATFQGKSD